MVSRDQIRAWTEASCAAQGIPTLVTDPVTVAQVGALLGVQADGPARRGSAEEPLPVDSQPPVRNDAGRVEGPTALGHGVRMDLDVVENGADDRALTVEVEAGPLTTEVA
jgi:hypothetical protein